jgi:DNA-binding response OmpR family regulator
VTLDDVFALLELDGEARTVLVVEDHLWLLRHLSELCEARGHRVISMLGIADIDGDTATGPSLDGTETFSLRGVQAVFLDHYFLSNRHNGQTLAKALRRYGNARILGMSSSESANQAMVRAGADDAMVKNDLIEIVRREL